MNHLRVAVLRGGPSEEYQVSMRTGATVLAALYEKQYQVKDIVITRNGEWLDGGLVRTPESALKAIDVVFVALHGAFGEDGEVQKILQRLRIPFTGSRAFPSAVAFNKTLTKKALAGVGVKTPRYREVQAGTEENILDLVQNIQNEFGPEYILKPVASGSSFGVTLVPPGGNLADALVESFKIHDRILIEEYIRGKEATVATLENFRNDSLYVFPAVEIVPPSTVQFFSTDSKYNGTTTEICPARFSYSERTKISEIAAAVHRELDLAQYSRSDFILGDDGVYFLEVNTLPGLTPESLYPKAAAAVGLKLEDLVVHLIEHATC